MLAWVGTGLWPYDRATWFLETFPVLIVFPLLYLTRRTFPLTHLLYFFIGLHALVLCVCLAFSAFYELLEWWTAVAWGQKADDFLATQGDPWDTQWDMFTALIGAAMALVVLGPVHDRALARRESGKLEAG